MNRVAQPFEEGVKGPMNQFPQLASTSWPPGSRPAASWPRKEVIDVSEERFRGASVRTLPRPTKSYGPGRVCADPGCETKLSVYNKWNYCWQHEPVHAYIPRGKRKRRVAA